MIMQCKCEIVKWLTQAFSEESFPVFMLPLVNYNFQLHINRVGGGGGGCRVTTVTTTSKPEKKNFKISAEPIQA